MADLTGVTAKLDRAEEHLATLDASLGTWRGSNPYTFTDAKNPDKTEIRFYAHFNIAPPVIRWAVLAGDCVHNLRSALDHLAWEATDSTKRGSSVEFPIFEDRDKFLNEGRGGGRYKIRGIESAETRDLICRYQPWHNPKGADQDSLWLIHEFDRMDKHQVLTPVGIVPREIAAQIAVEYATEEIATQAGPPVIIAPPFALKEGTEAFSLHFIAPYERVKMQANFTLGIALEYRGNVGGVTGILGNLCQHARRVVKELGDVFV
jgi:hypothetical protein